MEEILLLAKGPQRSLLLIGSSEVANDLLLELSGRIEGTLVMISPSLTSFCTSQDPCLEVVEFQLRLA